MDGADEDLDRCSKATPADDDLSVMQVSGAPTPPFEGMLEWRPPQPKHSFDRDSAEEAGDVEACQNAGDMLFGFELATADTPLFSRTYPQ